MEQSFGVAYEPANARGEVKCLADVKEKEEK
jgi:hypothetical protein